VLVKCVVDTNHVLVVVRLAHRRRDIIVLPRRGSGDIRHRHERQQFERGWIDAVLWDHIAWEGQSSSRIDETLLEKAEIACSFLSCGHDRLTRLTAPFTIAFERPKEECFVPNNWAAECAAILIEFQRRWRRSCEIISRLKLITTQKLPAGAAESIRTGFGYHVDDGARVSSELGREVAGLYFEFLNGVHIRTRL